MAKKLNKRLRRLKNKQEKDAAADAKAAAVLEDALKIVASPTVNEEVKSKFVTKAEKGKDDVAVPSPFTATIVKADKQNDEVPEGQATSVKLLRKIWTTMETKKKRSWTPTPIQLASWPVLLPTKNSEAPTIKNLIGIAATGSGKTLAYGVPMLIMANAATAKAGGVCGVILVPTRELATQIERELKIVATCLSPKQQQQLKIFSVYGGADRDDQMAWLCSSKKKCMLVTATPGRLVDLIQETRVKQALTDTVRMVVLDEADRMATCSDMAEQVENILEVIVSTDPDVNTGLCLYSATYPRSAKKKWNEWVSKPRAFIKLDTKVAVAAPSEEVGDDDDEQKKRKRGGGTMELAKIPAHVTQTMKYCSDEDEKVVSLIATLKKIRKDEVDSNTRRKGLCIVFFNRIKTLQNMSKIFNRELRMKVAQFHGKQEQEDRDDVLVEFKSGKFVTLFATDIAARGIHVNNLQYVINFDFPETLDQVSLCQRKMIRVLLCCS